MREAGHDGGGVLLGQIEQGSLQVFNQAADGGNFIAQPQADVGGDLVVAAAAGVQAFAGVADFVGEAAFDVHVHVFQIERPLQAACFDFGLDFGHAAPNVGQILRGEHAGFVQHLRVRERALDVVAGEALVEVDGGGVLFDEFGHGLVETAGPGFVVGGHDGVPWYEVGGWDGMGCRLLLAARVARTAAISRFILQLLDNGKPFGFIFRVYQALQDFRQAFAVRQGHNGQR